MKKFAMLSLTVFFGVVIGAVFVGTQIRITVGGVQPVQRSPGDVNGDGTLDIADVSAIANFLFGIPPATPLAATAASPEELDRILALEEGQAAILELLESQTATQESVIARMSAVEAGGTPIEGFTFDIVNEQGYPEYIHDMSGIRFVRLPGGSFNMGSPEDEAGRGPGEGPVHPVGLSPFLIAKYEVTEDEWDRVMGTGASTSNLPKRFVSWNTLHAPDGFLKRTGLLLPSEAQWEYACWAGSPTPFSFEADLSTCRFDTTQVEACDGCEEADEFMWWCGNSGNVTHPVGDKQANGFGLHDMHGNVNEWCRDVVSENLPYATDTPGFDPVVTAENLQNGIVRGGSFLSYPKLFRSANRQGVSLGSNRDTVGFRPVKGLP